MSLEQAVKVDREQTPIIEISEKYESVTSEHTAEYLKLLQIKKIEDIFEMKQSLMNRMQAERMISDEDMNSQELSFRVVSYTPNNQCLVLKVCYFRFTCIVTVITVKEVSPAHQIHTCFSGSFSTVYRAKIFDKEVAIKYLYQCVLQYFRRYLIFLIASVLKVGPKMDKMLGFDLVVYENCIQFCMEYCEISLHKHVETILDDLIDGVKALHSLKIIHFDIKPQNICYSREFKKAVLIDYGLHKIIEEEIGQKSLTQFRGSVAFSSEGMAQIFKNRSASHIDLYYNDAHCLFRSLDVIKNQKCGFIESSSISPIFNLTSSVILLTFKARLVDANYVYSASNDLSELKRKINLEQMRENAQEFFRFESMLKQQYLLSNTEKRKIDNQHSNRLQYQSRDPVEKNYFDLSKQQYFNSKKESLLRFSLTIAQKQFKQYIFILTSSLSQQENEKLKDLNFCKTLDEPLYIFLLSKYLQALNSKHSAANKLQICEVFITIYLNDPEIFDLRLVHKLSICYKYFIDFALRRNYLDFLSFEVIRYNLLVIIMFQSYEEHELSLVINKITDIPGPNLRRIRMFLSIIAILEWAQLRYISKYDYYALMNCVYEKCGRFLHFLQNGLLTSEEKQIIQYSKLLVFNQPQRVDLTMLQKSFRLKLYLNHTMTDEYSRVIAELYQIIIFRNIIIEKDNLSIQIANHFENMKELIRYQRTFSFQEPPLFLLMTMNLSKTSFFSHSKTYSPYKSSLFYNQFNSEDSESRYYVWSKELEQTQVLKKYSSVMKGQYPLQFCLPQGNEHHLFERFKINILYLKKIKDEKTAENDQFVKEQASKLKLLVPKCFNIMKKHQMHFHEHRMEDYTISILQIIEDLQLLFEVCTQEDVEQYYLALSNIVIHAPCHECRLHSLYFLQIHSVFKGICLPITPNEKDYFSLYLTPQRESILSKPLMKSLQSKVLSGIQETIFSIFTHILKTERSLLFICKFFSQSMHILKYYQLYDFHISAFKYNYVLLFYEATKMFNTKQIYFQLRKNDRWMPIIQLTLLQLWKMEDSDQYFQFIVEMCTLLNGEYVTQTHLESFYIQFNQFTTIFTPSGKFKFFYRNYQFFINRLKNEQNKVLATYLSKILKTKSQYIRISSLFYLYIWTYSDKRIADVREYPYLHFLRSQRLEMKKKKYAYLQNKCFRLRVIGKSSILEMIRIKFGTNRYHDFSRIHRLEFIKRISRIEQINKNEELKANQNLILPSKFIPSEY